MMMNYFDGLIFYLTVFIQFCNCINLNVLNNDLEICSTDPLTGFTRNGLCETNEYDEGNLYYN